MGSWGDVGGALSGMVGGGGLGQLLSLRSSRIIWPNLSQPVGLSTSFFFVTSDFCNLSSDRGTGRSGVRAGVPCVPVLLYFTTHKFVRIDPNLYKLRSVKS